MAAPAAEARATTDKSSGGSSSMVIVELDEPQSSVAVKRLRKGKGSLYKSVEQVVKDLTDEGTPPADGVAPADLYTNDFLDSSIALP